MWQLVADELISEEGIVTSIWESRKAFFDADKDGKLDALFIYSRHPKDDLKSSLAVLV
jgi:hypothetical protein